MTPRADPPLPGRVREGGERPTRRTARPQPPDDQPPGRDDAASRDEDDDMDQWVKQVADALPPLTDRQRDRLARLLRPPRNRAA
ncbi:MAG TPA: hypothetical protein VF070_41850 [Streptosporangiaceae bacterium]